MPTSDRNLLAELDEVPNLPVLSTHHQQLRRMMKSELTTPDQVVTLIERDPTFATNLMRLANSAFYARPTKVDSIKKAVQVIGFQGVSNLSWTMEVIGTFGSPKNIDIRRFWDHSVAVAVLSRQLAEQNQIDEDTAYLIGLLHDVGLLIVVEFLPDVFEELLADTREGKTIHESAETRFGCTQLDITIHLMKRWLFDETLYKPIEHLRRPAETVELPTKKKALTLYNAHKIAEAHEGAFEWDILPELPTEYEWMSSKEYTFVRGISAALLACCIESS